MGVRRRNLRPPQSQKPGRDGLGSALQGRLAADGSKGPQQLVPFLTPFLGRVPREMWTPMVSMVVPVYHLFFGQGSPY